MQDGRPHGLSVTLSFPRRKVALKGQDDGLGQVRQHRLPQIPPKDVYEGYMASGSY